MKLIRWFSLFSFLVLFTTNLLSQFAVKNIGSQNQAINDSKKFGSYYGYLNSNYHQIAIGQTLIGGIVFYMFDLPSSGSSGAVGYGAGATGVNGCCSFMPECGNSDILQVNSNVSYLNVRVSAGTSSNQVTFGGNAVKVFANQKLAYTGASPQVANSLTWYQIYLPNGYSSTTAWVADVNGTSLTVIQSQTSGTILAPSLKNISGLTKSSANLGWSPQNGFAPNLISYKIMLNSNLYGTTKDSFITLSNLSANTSYTVSIIAVYNSCSSTNSNSQNFKTPNSNTKPSVPTNFKVDAFSSDAIEMNWDKNSDATDYKVIDCTAGGNNLIASIDSTNYLVDKLQPQTQRCYQIKAYNSITNLESDPTNCLCATTTTLPTQKPSTPINLNAIALNSNSIKLSWSKTIDAVSYSIYSCNGNFIAQTIQLNYTITGLTEKTYYDYKITANNNIGSSLATACVGITTKSNGNGINFTLNVVNLSFDNRFAFNISQSVTHGTLIEKGESGIQVNFIQNGKTIDSYVTSAGGNVSGNIGQGNYDIMLTRAGISVLYSKIQIAKNGFIGEFKYHDGLLTQLNLLSIKIRTYYIPEIDDYIAGFNYANLDIYIKSKLQLSDLKMNLENEFDNMANMICGLSALNSIATNQIQLLALEAKVDMSQAELLGSIKILGPQIEKRFSELAEFNKQYNIYKGILGIGFNSVKGTMFLIGDNETGEIISKVERTVNCGHLKLSACVKTFFDLQKNEITKKRINNRFFNYTRSFTDFIVAQAQLNNSKNISLHDYWNNINSKVVISNIETEEILTSINKQLNIINFEEEIIKPIKALLDGVETISSIKGATDFAKQLGVTGIVMKSLAPIKSLARTAIKFQTLGISNNNLSIISDIILKDKMLVSDAKPQPNMQLKEEIENITLNVEWHKSEIENFISIVESDNLEPIKEKSNELNLSQFKLDKILTLYMQNLSNICTSNKDSNLYSTYLNNVFNPLVEVDYTSGKVYYILSFYCNDSNNYNYKTELLGLLRDYVEAYNQFLVLIPATLETFKDAKSYAAMRLEPTTVPDTLYRQQYNVFKLTYTNYGTTTAHNVQLVAQTDGGLTGLMNDSIALGDIEPYASYDIELPFSAPNYDTICHINYIISSDDAKSDGGSRSIQIIAKPKMQTSKLNAITKLNSSFSIYPNPANNLIYLESINKNEAFNNVVILDAIGKIVFHQSYTDITKTAIDISKLALGLYTVKIGTQLNIENYKIIIKR